MSKLSLSVIFRAFVGDAESQIATVADALSSAIVTVAVHGTYAPLVDALTSIDNLKGKAKYVLALREGLRASGLSLTPNSKGVQAPGLRVGKLAADAADTLAAGMVESFTIAASTVLTAKVTKPGATPGEVASKAFAALAGLTARQLRTALTGNDARAVLATLRMLDAEDAQALAAKAAEDALSKVMTIDAPAPIDAPAVDAPAVDVGVPALALAE